MAWITGSGIGHLGGEEAVKWITPRWIFGIYSMRMKVGVFGGILNTA